MDLKRWLALGIFWLSTLFVYVQTSQAAVSELPSKTLCAIWDGHFRQLLYYSMVGVALGASVLPFILLMFPRRSWKQTWPLRPLWAAGVSWLLAFLYLVVTPIIIGFGVFPFYSIDPKYLDCARAGYQAPGFFGVGSGVIAGDQWHLLTFALLLAAGVGFGATWCLHMGLKKWFGLAPR